MSIATWAELKSALASNTSGTFELTEGTLNCDEGIVLADKSDVTIKGAGRGRTIVRVNKSVSDCFRLWNNTHGITFSNFTIIGEVTSDDDVRSVPNRGIATTEWFVDSNGDASSIYPANVSDVSVADLEICNMTTGVQIGGQSNATDRRIANCHVQGSFIHHIYGKLLGFGYGVQAFHSPRLQVRDNVVHLATRHSVYYGNAESGMWALIIGNTIVDAGVVGVEQAAMSIARSSKVTVAHNLFVRSKTYALSVEKDGAWDPEDVQLIDNHFLDGVGTDIWIHTLSDDNRVLIWHNLNRANHSASVLLGSGSRFVPPLWSGTERIDRVGEYLHIIQNGTAHLVKPNYERLPTSPDAWPYVVLK